MGVNSIPIMSIHKSKGLEFEAVILLGLEDGAFWNFKHQSKEEAYTFFVALSRAKTKMIFTFCNNRFSGQARHEIRSIYQMLERSEERRVGKESKDRIRPQPTKEGAVSNEIETTV